MLGFLCYKIDANHFIVYTAVMLSITILYALFYYQKLISGPESILLYLVILIVYTIGSLTLIYPLWMSVLLFVLIVFILNAKKTILNFTQEINTYEFETLVKILLLSALILPLLPDTNVLPCLPLSPFTFQNLADSCCDFSYFL